MLSLLDYDVMCCRVPSVLRRWVWRVLWPVQGLLWEQPVHPGHVSELLRQVLAPPPWRHICHDVTGLKTSQIWWRHRLDDVTQMVDHDYAIKQWADGLFVVWDTFRIIEFVDVELGYLAYIRFTVYNLVTIKLWFWKSRVLFSGYLWLSNLSMQRCQIQIWASLG